MIEKVDQWTKREVVHFGENLMGVKVYFSNGPQPKEIPTHSHTQEQFTYVIDGEFEFSIAGKWIKVTKGDTLFFKSNEIHGARVNSETGMLLDVFSPVREDFLV